MSYVQTAMLLNSGDHLLNVYGGVFLYMEFFVLVS